ncbi:MAG: helix-turn-helix domain-containing protein [Methylacidiphilales bacterium]|nr:helix-turn-helix domain-containing protein [Candidatus Methylacidiphilales bacterium]
MTGAEAAAFLRISMKTLNAHIRGGAIRYVNVGLGTKRPRRRFTDSDLREFLERQSRMDVQPCQSIDRKTRRTTNSISSGKVLAFTDLRNARAAERQRQ